MTHFLLPGALARGFQDWEMLCGKGWDWFLAPLRSLSSQGRTFSQNPGSRPWLGRWGCKSIKSWPQFHTQEMGFEPTWLLRPLYSTPLLFLTRYRGSLKGVMKLGLGCRWLLLTALQGLGVGWWRARSGEG